MAEDEPELLRSYKILLEDLGHEVITSKDGDQCLGMYRKALSVNQPFDLVILDHRMPKKNGMEVAEEIAAMVPSQKLLMITAYAGLLNLQVKPENMKIMQKPFDTEELISTIKQLE